MPVMSHLPSLRPGTHLRSSDGRFRNLHHAGPVQAWTSASRAVRDMAKSAGASVTARSDGGITLRFRTHDGALSAFRALSEQGYRCEQGARPGVLHVLSDKRPVHEGARDTTRIMRRKDVYIHVPTSRHPSHQAAQAHLEKHLPPLVEIEPAGMGRDGDKPSYVFRLRHRWMAAPVRASLNSHCPGCSLKVESVQGDVLARSVTNNIRLPAKAERGMAYRVSYGSGEPAIVFSKQAVSAVADRSTGVSYGTASLIGRMDAALKENRLVGGKGDKRTIKDFDPEQVKMGLRVEREHTSTKAEAEEIVCDHLSEDPRYYTKLLRAGLADELAK